MNTKDEVHHTKPKSMIKKNKKKRQHKKQHNRKMNSISTERLREYSNTIMDKRKKKKQYNYSDKEGEKFFGDELSFDQS